MHNGALVAIDSATGEIVAYVGSIDYYNRKDERVRGQFDVAGLSVRQPGSAFKPIVYSAAFRAREATPATFFVDSVTQFGADRATSYMPTNADINQPPLDRQEHLSGTFDAVGLASAEALAGGAHVQSAKWPWTAPPLISLQRNFIGTSPGAWAFNGGRDVDERRRRCGLGGLAVSGFLREPVRGAAPAWLPADR